ncbi:MAG: amidohydrolase family protein [Ilumatobacteraceae bacterium]
MRTDTAIASCPLAYLRLGQGYARHARHADFLARGGRLGLGSDSENAGDSMDLLRVAATFAGLSKDLALDSTRSGAHEALELLTIGGAKALGLERVIGSLESGKRGDVVVHRTDHPAWQPMSPDPILALVWSAQGVTVDDVVIDGRVVVRNGRSTWIDEDHLASRARVAGAALAERAGLPVASRWPIE